MVMFFLYITNAQGVSETEKLAVSIATELAMQSAKGVLVSSGVPPALADVVVRDLAGSAEEIIKVARRRLKNLPEDISKTYKKIKKDEEKTKKWARKVKKDSLKVKKWTRRAEKDLQHFFKTSK